MMKKMNDAEEMFDMKGPQVYQPAANDSPDKKARDTAQPDIQNIQIENDPQNIQQQPQSNRIDQ